METVPVAFARVAREAGLDVPVSSVLAYAEALHATGVERRRDVYWAGRATMVRRPEDVAAYDAAFAAFWLGAAGAAAPPAAVTEAEADAGPASAIEVLKHKDFAGFSDEEFAEARRLMAQFKLTGAVRQTRRLAAATKGRPDLRRTVRTALRTQGLPIHRRWQAPTTAPRRLVFLLDVSGSMEPYARALIRFVHAAVVGRRKVDAFAIGTRVTRITRELHWRDPDAAVNTAAARVEDWSGGTRLGDGLKEFNDRWGGRGATVVVLSDGWDRGDPEHIAAQMARLRRVAHRVVWVNPHKASPGFEPLARGMAAALPYVDDFVDGHSLAALEDLARRIDR